VAQAGCRVVFFFLAPAWLPSFTDIRSGFISLTFKLNFKTVL